MALTAIPLATFPDETGPLDLARVDGAWTVTHHNVEDDEPSVFAFDSIPSAMRFLYGCGVSRTIRG
jgi:hypothetical protein